MRQTYQLALAPKKSKPEYMGDLRPIALCNVLYKIVSKVLANHLKLLLSTIISEAQCAFLPRRLIRDNIMLAFEVQHFFKHKTQGKEGWAALNIDMSKAYDKIEWLFLKAVMSRLGLSNKWITLIWECISTVSYHIIKEGSEIGPIMPQRGLRHGNPLSPYLFILVTESLSSMIRKQGVLNSIHGITIVKGAPRITHLMFVDDCSLYFKENIFENQVIKVIMSKYVAASGQVINLTKSSLSLNRNVESVSLSCVEEVLGVQRGEPNNKYLGFSSLVGRNKKEILGFIKRRIIAKINNWNSRFLSRSGREMLLKNVVQVIPTFAMSVFLLPNDLCTKIERIMNSFWWGCENKEGKGIRWKA